ncbi:MAG: hypothetical protein EXR75_10080 [Myxococcales bacterium]|nr:hypothetical protein [Myxococcales bacterium]
MRRVLPVLALLLANHALANHAHAAEPWADPDPEKPPQRHEIGAIGVVADAEYRAQAIFVDPISLNTETQRNFAVVEHRGRFGGTIDYQETVKLTLSVDLLDGVLWGDNGTFGVEPSSNGGIQVATRGPNVTKACIRLREGGDPLVAEGYGFGLCDADVVSVRRMFGQVNTPIGSLRVGRMPVGVGLGVQNTDGDGRRNRFGVAGAGDSVDRVLFATKPLEALKPKADRNLREDEGLRVAAMFDRYSEDSPILYDDDVNQVATAVLFGLPEFSFGSDLALLAFYAHRWNTQHSTLVHTVGGRAVATFDRLRAGIDFAANLGETSEVSRAYAVINNDPAVAQQIRQLGARAVVRWDEPMFSAYLEGDFASGDGDPQARTPLTQFRWSEDANVGLLLFEHVLRFQSARASAAGVEITRRLGATSFPAERVDTQGAFTDAVAIFPQVDVRPHESLLLRGGVLFAWAPAPVVDPVACLQARDGQVIDDDLVNFVGGKPGQFYGVELDLRAQWRFLDHFALDVEGAVLLPGDALQDENGDAVKSFLAQARTTFYY